MNPRLNQPTNQPSSSTPPSFSNICSKRQKYKKKIVSHFPFAFTTDRSNVNWQMSQCNAKRYRFDHIAHQIKNLNRSFFKYFIIRNVSGEYPRTFMPANLYECVLFCRDETVEMEYAKWTWTCLFCTLTIIKRVPTPTFPLAPLFGITQKRQDIRNQFNCISLLFASFWYAGLWFEA